MTTTTRSHRAIDPILSLSLPREASEKSRELGRASSLASISSVCFLNSSARTSNNTGASDLLNCIDNGDESDEDADDNDMGDDCESMSFRCRTLAHATPNSSVHQSAAALELEGRFLVSAHRDGSTLLWHLGQQRVVTSTSILKNRGPATLLRRTDTTAHYSQSLLFQTRDDKGTVSLHDANQPDLPTTNSTETYSQTFCAACPCDYNPNLVALPDRQDSVVVVRDWRLASNSKPIATIQNSTQDNKNGMVLSLGFSETSTAALGRPILACGMESGKVLWYDLAMPSLPLSRSAGSTISLSTSLCAIQLGRDPVLALDLVPSNCSSIIQNDARHELQAEGVVAAAGLAAHRDDLIDTSEEQSGPVVVLKATRDIRRGNTLQARIGSRRATYHVPSDSASQSAGKPGVSLCRFRPDGRLFAVGGWDKRVRLFDRNNSAAPLAILRGHTDSVNAVDWAPDAADSGVCATGADDGRLLIWQCLPERRKTVAPR
jgi:WD40 repeat protein